MSGDLNISAVASELHIRREGVKALIRTGALAAYDVTPPGAKRKAYRIPRESLDAFKAGRSAREYKPSKRRARVTKQKGFVEYFK